MKNIIYFYYAVFFGAIGLIAADIFIPSMSSIATHFNVDISIIQSSIAVFMLGFSLARCFISIISDGLGRKGMFILCFTL
jgi:MFS family permease